MNNTLVRGSRSLAAAVVLAAGTMTGCSVVRPIGNALFGAPAEVTPANDPLVHAPPLDPMTGELADPGAPPSPVDGKGTVASSIPDTDAFRTTERPLEPGVTPPPPAAPTQQHVQVAQQPAQQGLFPAVFEAVFSPFVPANQNNPTGLTSGEQFDSFGNTPVTTAPAVVPNTSFDGTENLRQITFSTEGRTFDPVLSPDGSHVYFASTRHSPTADIYVKQIGSTAVVKLSSSPAHDVMPAVSPDNQRVAFASNRNGSYDIYITNADGGGQAAQVTFDPAHELHPSWSPDGQHIAYCRLGVASDRWEIWIADATNPGKQTFLTHGLFPTWHPTENRILFQRSRNRGDRYFAVWTIDYVDGEAIRPTEIASSSIAAVINPSWSRDGAYIAFSTIVNPGEVIAGEAEVADLWICKADGTQRANLTGGFSANLMPDFAPDGTLYFVSDRAGVDNIWSVRPMRAIQAASVPPASTNTDLADVPVDSGE